MKFNNAKHSAVVKTIRLPKTELDITIHSIPVGSVRRLDKFMSEPKAPVITTTDAVTKKTTRESNWYDEKFQVALKEYNHLKTIWQVYLVIKDDANINFETKDIKSADDLRAFDLELQESGLSEGDVGFILREAMELSNLTIKEIEEEKKVF